MKGLNTFLYEGKHFVRNPFKVIALLLFVLAGIYGLHNGASLYKKQQLEIEKINQKIETDQQKVIEYYESNNVGPKDRPWVNVREPYWAVWYSSTYEFKKPSPAMVYSIGQAEQYGFYKKVTFNSSPYDADMAEEIANPERLQTGTLDFSFVILFLLPLVLLILIYNLKSYESEQGFLQLILVQSASKNSWLLYRVLFYFILIFLTIILLLVYGATLTGVFANESNVFGNIVILVFLYQLFWGIFYFIILLRGKSILSNTLQMVGVYLIFTFIIPATVHQWVSIEKPTNLMVDYIDVKRDKTQDLYDEPDSIVQSKLNALFPKIENTVLAKDTLRNTKAMNRSISALTNELMKESLGFIQKESEAKNAIIQSTYWYNPVAYFQNQLNKKAETHYENYQQYRDRIQTTVDRQIQIMVPDIYNDIKVDKEKYLDYINQINYDQ
ncbi:hypothetical protein [Winogradskyella sp. 3972H.M.0a.05]|uniref:hypothetical protein n=1 Tax=Winogradskyella sp. 3972H.M.0a.05 TaxID=2950277 RepID=UPI003397F6C8